MQKTNQLTTYSFGTTWNLHPSDCDLWIEEIQYNFDLLFKLLLNLLVHQCFKSYTPSIDIVQIFRCNNILINIIEYLHTMWMKHYFPPTILYPYIPTAILLPIYHLKSLPTYLLWTINYLFTYPSTYQISCNLPINYLMFLLISYLHN
jgi:hypothetical protein